jgi:hypothetical protein
MSKILPVILLVGGLYYFSTTVSGESPVQGCMDETATNYDPDATEDDSSCKYGNGNENPPGTDPPDVIDPLPGCPPVGGNTIWGGKHRSYDRTTGSNALDNIHIQEVTTNQKNYYPGNQVDITWEAKVENRSATRCGEGILGGNKTCWFAPTGGSALGDYEGPLYWELKLNTPDGNQYTKETISGGVAFTGYTNTDISVDPDCTDPECLEDLKDAWAKYQFAFPLGADAPEGQYEIEFRAEYPGSGGSEYANWEPIASFKVLSSDCNPEGFSAESTKINYETRFASNHDFMLY